MRDEATTDLTAVTVTNRTNDSRPGQARPGQAMESSGVYKHIEGERGGHRSLGKGSPFDPSKRPRSTRDYPRNTCHLTTELSEYPLLPPPTRLSPYETRNDFLAITCQLNRRSSSALPCRGRRVVENDVFFAWIIGRLKFLLSRGYEEREKERERRRIIWNNGYVGNGKGRGKGEISRKRGIRIHFI